MSKQAGFTLTEMAVAIAVATLVATSAVSTSMPLLAREKLRSATYQMQSLLQVSRTEAVSRNSPTRFLLNPRTRTLESWDTKGTTTTADDELLRRVNLPELVSLASPDDEEAVTLDEGEGESYGTFEAVFRSDGSLASSSGAISLYSGHDFKKVTLYAAGGVDVANWGGSEWEHTGTEGSSVLNEKWAATREGFEDDWIDVVDGKNGTMNRETTEELQ